jgi:preprotein translocase subunit SecA
MRSLSSLAQRIFGTTNDGKTADAAARLVARINALEAQMQKCPDDGLRQITQALKSRVRAGESLDALLPEAFAACREAGRRAIGLRAFDVQLLGGIHLHRGNVIEMQTGEGKTLVATFPAYLNALAGKGVHIVTANDYLAKRDSEWMGKIYALLGLGVGIIQPRQSDAMKRAAYAADVTYATYSELGFDYLHDNMKSSLADLVQRKHAFAIIDEVDSILIDEARTPLVISGPRRDDTGIYAKVDAIMADLRPEHFVRDENSSIVSLTENGDNFVEVGLRSAGLLKADQSLFDQEDVHLAHAVLQALRAHTMYVRDKHYIVADGEVKLVDQNTGRSLNGRRLSEGLHQAIEAKEKVDINPETVTIASITVQNHFRLYEKLAGMTGTAATDAEEFAETYKLGVIQIAPNRPVQRKDQADRIYRTWKAKNEAIVGAIRKAQAVGQPILLGTTSVARSEEISKLLAEAGIAHHLLNAREHEREAHIVANAGRLGAVTVSTNMAGRGTDIQLGGNLEEKNNHAPATQPTREPSLVRAEVEQAHAAERQQVIAAGGLLVLGTERHESRRIDNQLRGRSGRQGDPGMSCFFLSLEDDLLANFEPGRLATLVSKDREMPDDVSADRSIGKLMASAQKRAEEQNHEIRKQLLEFDDVLNNQRKVIFALRSDLLGESDIAAVVADMRNRVIGGLVGHYLPEETLPDLWDSAGLRAACQSQLMLLLPISEWAAEKGIDRDAVRRRIERAGEEFAARKSAAYGQEAMRNAQKILLLQIIDGLWRDHLVQMEYLRAVIGYRTAGRRNPLHEYRTEAFDLFEAMIDALRREVTLQMAKLSPMASAQQNDLLAELLALKRN